MKQLKNFKEYLLRQWKKYQGRGKSSLQYLLGILLVLAVLGLLVGFVVGINYGIALIIQTVLASFGKQLELWVCWLIWFFIYLIAQLFNDN